MSILITGGAGYIGSHTLIELHSLSNSSKESIKRVEKIINKDIIFEEVLIHFAGLKVLKNHLSIMTIM